MERFRINDEIGTYLKVPLDYANPSKGTTQIWTYTLMPFDAQKPSMIYISGGPGGWSRGLAEMATKMANWNVIYFDQRGTGFSKPATEEIMRDRSYMSSRITALDIDQIRKHYGIEKLSVYGHSYGTVVGTIYAHLFATNTRALVIEGVVDNGEPGLWLAPHRIKRIQKVFNQLSKEQQDKVIELSSHPEVPPTWFHDYARLGMYDENFEASVQSFVKSLFLGIDGPVTLQRFGNYDRMLEDQAFFGAFTFAQITCRELSMTKSESTWNFVFQNRKLVAAPMPIFKNVCEDLGWNAQNIETYNSLNYPLTVPVTYINGTTDGATVAPAAIHHFKWTAKGRAQLFLIPSSGHTPMFTYLVGSKMGGPEKDIYSMFEKALRGQFLLKSDLKKLPNWKGTRK